MLANYTDITVLLDRSASMYSTASATREAFNGFLAEQRNIPGEARLTLVQFSDPQDFSFTFRDLPIRTEYGLTPLNYNPTGRATALRDSLVKLIDLRGFEYRNTVESARPNRVLFVIVTDGLDNASWNYGQGTARDRVQHQASHYQWQFVYLGANQDAVLRGVEYGVSAAASMTYNPTKECVNSMLRSLSIETSKYRTQENYLLAFDDTARRNASVDPAQDSKA